MRPHLDAVGVQALQVDVVAAVRVVEPRHVAAAVGAHRDLRLDLLAAAVGEREVTAREGRPLRRGGPRRGDERGARRRATMPAAAREAERIDDLPGAGVGGCRPGCRRTLPEAGGRWRLHRSRRAIRIRACSRSSCSRPPAAGVRATWSGVQRTSPAQRQGFRPLQESSRADAPVGAAVVEPGAVERARSSGRPPGTRNPVRGFSGRATSRAPDGARTGRRGSSRGRLSRVAARRPRRSGRRRGCAPDRRLPRRRRPDR